MPNRQPDTSQPVELNQALRELIEVVRTADLDGVELNAAIAQIRALRDDLQSCVVDGERTQSALVFEVPNSATLSAGHEHDHGAFRQSNPPDFFPYSPVVGLLNPISPPATMARVVVDNGFEIHGTVTFSTVFNGPPNCVHGGALAALLDELLGSACVVNGIGGYTGTLTVVYRSPTPLGTLLHLRGWVERSEGRKVFAAGTLHSGDTLCVQADGIFLQDDTLRSPMP